MQTAIQGDAIEGDKGSYKNNECFGAHAISVAGFLSPR